jgi:uncharacterized protein (DUF1684 family)
MDPPLITSSRRFERRRPSEIFYGWVKLHALFWLGVSPDRLADIYRTHAPPPEMPERRRARKAFATRVHHHVSGTREAQHWRRPTSS